MAGDGLARILPKPNNFSGEPGDWHDWKFVFTAWVAALMPGMDARMSQAADSSDQELLRFDDFAEDSKRPSSNMMGALVGLAQGKALLVVQGTPHARNGFEAWRWLVRTLEADAPVRRMVMLSSVLSLTQRAPTSATSSTIGRTSCGSTSAASQQVRPSASPSR